MRALQQRPADSRRINVVLGAHKGGTAAMNKYIGCDAHARYTPLLACRDYLPLPPTGEAACLEMPAASNPVSRTTSRNVDRPQNGLLHVGGSPDLPSPRPPKPGRRRRHRAWL